MGLRHPRGQRTHAQAEVGAAAAAPLASAKF